MFFQEVKESVLLEAISKQYDLAGYEIIPIQEHEGGRNKVYILHGNDVEDVILRISNLDDRSKEDYLAELEFVHYLHKNGAPVADVIESSHHHLLEQITITNCVFTVCMFQRAKGKLLVENHYQ